jgi:uncharacterized phosphosugar-binding protein
MAFRKSSLGLFVALTLIAASLLSLVSVSTGRENGKKNDRTNLSGLGNYADLYLRGSYDILHIMKVREADKIGLACKIAVQKKMSGGKIVSGIGTPHIMYAGACSADMPGNPNIAPDPKNQNEGYKGEPKLGAGDFLLVSNPSKYIEEARKNGCFVTGISFPMTTNKYSPPNFNDHPDYFIESMTDIFIYTWGPVEDGLITPSMTPNLKILPTSPMTVAGYWTLMSQLSYNLAYKDTSGSSVYARAYLDTLMARLDRFHGAYLDDVCNAGEIIAEKVLKGGKIYPWSSRREFFIESNGTAGGLMGVYDLNPDSLTAKDVVIIAVSDSTPNAETAMAVKAKAKGAWVLGIFPFDSKIGSTATLKKNCDVALDNLSGEKYGVFDIPGYPNRVIPTSTMMNNYAFWAVVGAYVQAMENRGVAPYYWMSFHVPGGKAYDDSIRPYFLKRGY